MLVINNLSFFIKNRRVIKNTQIVIKNPNYFSFSFWFSFFFAIFAYTNENEDENEDRSFELSSYRIIEESNYRNNK